MKLLFHFSVFTSHVLGIFMSQIWSSYLQLSHPKSLGLSFSSFFFLNLLQCFMLYAIPQQESKDFYQKGNDSKVKETW